MRVDIWSDVVCPWCWLGKARFEKALASFPQRDQVEVVFRSFELDPRAPKDLDVSANEMLAKKYGIGPAQIATMHERLQSLAAAEGLAFDFQASRMANTFDAHQVIHLGRSHGKQAATADRLFRAQFQEGARVGDRAELVRLGTDAGLDAAEVRSALEEQRFAAAVREDLDQARALGISGVPFYVLDGALGVSGAQSVEVFRQALDQAWETRR
jgi:predicted DsbA family dithiol-disulfide isomerase